MTPTAVLSLLAALSPPVAVYATCSTSIDDGNVIETDVLIIGAGMCGLSAAKTLREVDPDLDILIIEAQNGRVGGRVRSNDEWFTTDDGDPIFVEEGAQWFSDNTANPGLALANRYGVDMYIQDFDDFNLYEYDPDTSDDANPVPERDYFRADTNFFVSWNCLQREGDALYKNTGKPNFNPQTEGANDVLEDVCGWDPSLEEEFSNLDEFSKWFYNDYEIGEDDTSMYIFSVRKTQISKFFLIKDQEGGFEKIPMDFANEFLLSDGADDFLQSSYFMFDQNASAIYYDLDDDDYPTAVETNLDDDGCPTSDSYRIEAKRIIQTFSVGVQNGGDITYDPPLEYPGSNPFEMTDYVKVYYPSKENFWSETDDREFIVTIKEDFENDHCFHWQNLDFSSGKRKGPKQTSPDIIPGSKILFCTLTTEAFRGLLDDSGEDFLTEAQLGDLLEPLRRVFGADVVDDNIDLGDVRYPMLHTNPCFLGSYESWQVGYNIKDFYNWHGGILPGRTPLVEPCEHNGCTDDDIWTLHISGSASCLEHWGLVRGAISAGERSANYVLADIGCGGDGCDVDIESICEDSLFSNNGNGRGGTRLRHAL